MHFGRDYYDEEFENDDMINNFSGPPSRFKHPRSMHMNRNDAYNNAYGDYRGGYGPSSGFGNNWRGPPPRFGPPGPPGPFRLPGPPMPFGRPPKSFGPPPLLPPPHVPEFPWGRGFGPRGPPMKRPHIDDKTIKYLIKCGLTKESLKYLPRELLALYEPEYCGLCAFNLESHAVSRMHYLSKNHQKNQKKWLTQKSDEGSRKNKEIPIKSRDLYCELCDVHITSKSHSDSHYSGKPHRAIVEGRKNPRNPLLLQRGMENRLELLIRREKKFIKISPSEAGESGDAAGDNKPVASDLYCDICKTSVTCSEQMTMHLNGKRHLSKEKQHILRMMTGEKGDEADESVAEDGEEMDPKDGEEKQDGGAAEEGKAVEGAAGVVDSHDDWANGNGTWEETPNTN